MGRVSRRKIHPEVKERVFMVFWQTLADMKNPYEIQVFLQNLLSYTEQSMLSKRLAIALLLHRGYNYQGIEDALKVSKSTILSVHKQIMIGAEGYKLAIKKTLERRKKEQFWDGMEELLLKASLPARYGSIKFHRKSQMGKEISKRKRQRGVL